MGNMLFKAKYICEQEMEAQVIDKDDDYKYMLATKRKNTCKDYHFKEELYKCKLRNIGIYFSIIKR